MQFTIIVSYTFTKEWLKLDRDGRNAYEAEHVEPLFTKYADRVQARFFDAEAFSVKPSDFMILTTQDLQAYYFLIEELRDCPLTTSGYVEFDNIKIGIEDGYKSFEEEAAK